MAAVPITINGIQTDENGSRNVTIVGMASLTGLGVGGGPVLPPSGDGKPPGIWGGGNVPMPTPPIANVPGLPPTQNPPGFGAHPEHPIVLPPDEGTKPPEPIQPPVEWKVVWHPTEGWMVVGVPNVPHPAPSA